MAGTGKRFAGADFLASYQAFRLGAGLGTTNLSGSEIDEFVTRFLEISEKVTFPSADSSGRSGPR
ncbi:MULTISPECIES: hypothetical protein [Pseudofrankia]|uniref:hypothetical protein n=1 Tax=Pseudofrankia TaxID=2994363 RepID=UPI000234C7D7|nr:MULTISPECIES: hypothetical protein [Pseudofrankia]OHV40395.1 hypothetical protein BCD49_39620 [Pseudofrankia sp. EUN1h]